MGMMIVKLEGKYLLWSTSSDSPGSYGLTLTELRAHIKEEQGNEGLRDLERRLVRVEEKGTSSIDCPNVDSTIMHNRADRTVRGKEGSLHREEIVEFYIRRGEEPTVITLAAFRKGLKRCGPKCPDLPDANGCSMHCDWCWGSDFVRP
jgi:hypothetical protein